VSSPDPSDLRIGTFQARLLDWFGRCGRRFPWRLAHATKYERIVSEILLQRTRAATVGAFFPEFCARFPSWPAIALASDHELRAFLRPIGLWRRRAAVLRELATEMVRRKGRFPRRRELLEKMPGVGQYVASAVLLFCYSTPEPLLDAGMARVLERYFGPRELADIRYDPYLQSLSARVVNGDNAISVNWGILDLAALVCKPRFPLCGSCPLARGCQFRSSSSATLGRRRDRHCAARRR
jgi:A/G-specific adenine glycosylase